MPPAAPRLTPPQVLSLLLLSASCTFPTDAERFPVPGAAPLALLSATPADGAADQPVDVRVALRLSDFPDPATAGAVRLLAGGAPIEAAVEIDLPSRTLLLRPRDPLPAASDFEVQLGAGLRALSGAAMAPRSLRFRTGAGSAAYPPEPAVTYAEVLGSMGAVKGCLVPAGSCHAPAPGLGAARGLDLSAPAAEVRRYLTTTIARGAPDQLLLVEPGHPERSYLLRKLLGYDGFVRIEGAPMPFDPFFEPADPRGRRRLPDAALTAVSGWIRQGAPL